MSSRYSLPPEWSAEEEVSEDWAGVAQAISQRMTELGINQRELIERSRVSNIGEPVSRSDDDVPGRLAAIEYRLAQIETRLVAIDELSNRLEEIKCQH